jgi:hypothetical protein
LGPVASTLTTTPPRRLLFREIMAVSMRIIRNH